MENPTLIPKRKDSVVYCTCPMIKPAVYFAASSGHAFLEDQVSKGWTGRLEKRKGYPVELYKNHFTSILGT